MPDELSDNSTQNRRSRAAHLRPHWFKPGESGNPGGRPARPLTERLLAQLMKSDGAEAAAIVRALLDKAKTGDVAAYNSIRDSVEGKPTQNLELKQQGTVEVIL